MEWTNNLLFAPLLCSAVFFVAGLVMWIFPPKKINVLYGYRTSSSMKSIERWDFAQKHSAKLLLICAFGLIVISAAGLLITPEWTYRKILEIIIVVLPCGYMFWSTEKAIRKNFPIQ
ncbi:MAG TPA: SdpI family protein [Flavobacterium sp.]|jgi:uncharacterized membrane protein